MRSGQRCMRQRWQPSYQWEVSWGASGEAWLATGCQRTAVAPGSLEVLLVAKLLQQRRQRVSVIQKCIDLSSWWLSRYKLEISSRLRMSGHPVTSSYTGLHYVLSRYN